MASLSASAKVCVGTGSLQPALCRRFALLCEPLLSRVSLRLHPNQALTHGEP